MNENYFTMALYNPEPVDIHIGAWYTIHKHTGDGQHHAIKMRAIKAYSKHVLFEDERGIRESITWWDIARIVT